MEKWSLSKKIWAVIGILTFSFVLSAGFSIYGLLSGRELLGELTQTVLKRSRLTSEIMDNQRRLIITSQENILRTDEASLKKVKKDWAHLLKEMDADIKTYSEIASPEGKAIIDKYLALYEGFLETSQAAFELGMQNKNEEAAAQLFSLDETRQQMLGYLAELSKLNASRVDALSQKANDSALFSIILSSILAAVSITVSLVVASLTLRKVTASIDEVVRNLSDSSLQVSGAASQIASSAEELSRATTEQAASLEQTAASVEELNSMIARNSENAKSAEQTSGSSQQAVSQGQEVVRKMMESMEAINRSSEGMAETVKVIEQIDKKARVINEIVNKTELLSFNASVEAARAGEHGKGFAVVAEEVGNLARMSGAAAEEIASLLEESISKVNQMVQETKRNVDVGAQVARECGGVFEQIVQNVTSVSGMATEIASASGEQARGCSEITKAMSQLDQMTQQNAATSEECAASAEELSAQAESLRGAVAFLVRTINGQEKQGSSGTESEAHAGPVGAPTAHAPLKHSQPKASSSLSAQVVHLSSSKKPEAQGMTANPSTAAFKMVANGTPAYDSDGFQDI